MNIYYQAVEAFASFAKQKGFITSLIAIEMNLSRFLRYIYLRLKRLRGTPRYLACGTAVGVFVGFTPTMPLHTVLIILFALITRSSPVAGIISSWIICNPFTFLPLYSLSIVIGNLVTPFELNVEKVLAGLEYIRAADDLQKSLTMIGTMGYETLAVMLAGGICMAMPMAVLSYYGTLPFFRRLQARSMNKHVPR